MIATGTFATDDGKLIGVALWESEDAFRAGVGAGREAIGDPFDEWETGEIQMIRASEV